VLAGCCSRSWPPIQASNCNTIYLASIRNECPAERAWSRVNGSSLPLDILWV
jgi:hypothetical protein